MNLNVKPFCTRLFSATNAQIIGLAGMAFMSQLSVALDYGIYDARSLALGGTGVASGTTQNAVFYNPAMLAFYEGQEEDSRNGRVYLPMVVAQLDEDVEEPLDVIEQDLDDQLSQAINNYNADMSSENAAAVALASAALENGLRTIGNRDINGDAFIGFMVSEPSDGAGGSFYFGSRAVTGGASILSPEDLDLLNDYSEAMAFVGGDTVNGVEHTELFDEDGNLIDPADQVTSSVDFGSLVITEWGVAVSKEFEFWGQSVAFGVTPKAMRVDVYRDDLSYSDSDYDYDEDKRSHFTMNTDVGIAVPIGKHFRVGLAAKDIVPQEFEGANELVVKTKARTRFAAAYTHRYVNFAVDVDLQKTEALGTGLPGQEVGAGLEVTLFPWVHFRGGYRQDLEGFKDSVISGGVGFKTGRFVADLAYAVSEDIQGGGVQMGWTF